MYKKIHRFEKALYYSEKYIELNNELSNESKLKEINKNILSYETKRKRNSNSSIGKKVKRIRTAGFYIKTNIDLFYFNRLFCDYHHHNGLFKRCEPKK